MGSIYIMEIKKLVGQGKTAKIYELNKEKVIKIFNENFDIKAITSEFHVSSLVNEMFPNFTPKVFSLDNKSIVLEYVKGTPLIEQMSFKTLIPTAKLLVKLQREIHEKKVETSFKQLEDVLSGIIEKSPDITLSTRSMLWSYLKNHNKPSSVCHGDFHPGNIIITANKEYVIDWANVMIGNALYDVARTYILIRYGTIDKVMNLSERIVLSIYRLALAKIYYWSYMFKNRINNNSFHYWLVYALLIRLSEISDSKEKKTLTKIFNKEIRKVY